MFLRRRHAPLFSCSFSFNHPLSPSHSSVMKLIIECNPHSSQTAMIVLSQKPDHRLSFVKTFQHGERNTHWNDQYGAQPHIVPAQRDESTMWRKSCNGD